MPGDDPNIDTRSVRSPPRAFSKSTVRCSEICRPRRVTRRCCAKKASASTPSARRRRSNDLPTTSSAAHYRSSNLTLLEDTRPHLRVDKLSGRSVPDTLRVLDALGASAFSTSRGATLTLRSGIRTSALAQSLKAREGLFRQEARLHGVCSDIDTKFRDLTLDSRRRKCRPMSRLEGPFPEVFVDKARERLLPSVSRVRKKLRDQSAQLHLGDFVKRFLGRGLSLVEEFGEIDRF